MRFDLSSYFEDPELKETLAKYEGMVKNHTPAYFDADELTDIAEYYAAHERQEEAEQVIDFALRLHPNDTDVLIFHARTLAMKGDLDGAYQVADLIEDKNDIEARFLQADLLMEQNKMEEADLIFQQMAAEEDNELDLLFDIVMDYIEVNQAYYAAEWIKRINELYDVEKLIRKNRKFRDMMSEFHLTFNEPDKAIPFLRITLDEDPYSIPHWVELGKCCIQAFKLPEAHEALDFALAIDDKHPEALTLKAFAYHQQNDMKKSVEYFQKVRDLDLGNPRPVLQLAYTYFDMQDYRMALNYMKTFMSMRGKTSSYEDAEHFSFLALCYAGVKEWDEGSRYLIDAEALDRNNPLLKLNGAQFYLMMGEKMLVEAFIHDALKLVPADERSFYLMKSATLCFDYQAFDLAKQYFETIVKESPEEGKSAYFFLMYCCFYLEDSIGVMHYFARIQREMPDVYAEMGNPEEAILSDKRFNNLLQALKEGVKDGSIDLSKY